MAAKKSLIAFTLILVALPAGYIALSYLPRARSSEAAISRIVTVPAECRDATWVRRLEALPEASGLAVSLRHPDLLWSHNDSADALLFGIGRDGAVKSRVRVTGATVEDWEAVTTAKCPQGSCVYVGDIGDNNARRPRIVIYRVVEPAPNESATAPVETFAATYPDGPQDAEALFATSDGMLYVVTKGEGAPVQLYRIGELGATAPIRMTRVAALTFNTESATKAGRVTDAAVSPDGHWVVLRTNQRLLFYKTTDLLAGRPGTPREFDLGALNEPQGEGVAWLSDNTLYLAGEGGGGGTLARVSCTLP